MDRKPEINEFEKLAIEKQLKEKEIISEEEAEKKYRERMATYDWWYDSDVEHGTEFIDEDIKKYEELGLPDNVIYSICGNGYNTGRKYYEFIEKVKNEGKFNIIKFVIENPILFINCIQDNFYYNINYLYNCQKSSDEMTEIFLKYPFLLGESIENYFAIIEKLHEENIVSKDVLHKIFDLSFKENDYYAENIKCLNICNLLMDVDLYSDIPYHFDIYFDTYYKEYGLFGGINLSEIRCDTLSAQLKLALKEGYISYNSINNPIELNELLHNGFANTSIKSNEKFLYNILINKNKFNNFKNDKTFKKLEENCLLINSKLNGINHEFFKNLINYASSENILNYCKSIDNNDNNFVSSFYTYIYKYIKKNNICKFEEIDYNNFLINLNNNFTRDFSNEEILSILEHDSYSYESLPIKYQTERKVVLTAMKYGYPKSKIINILQKNGLYKNTLKKVEQNFIDISIEFINNNYIGDYLHNREKISQNIKNDLLEGLNKDTNIAPYLLLLNNFCVRNGEIMIQQLQTNLFENDIFEYEKYEENKKDLDNISQKVETAYNLNNLAHHEYDVYLVAKLLQDDRINLTIKKSKDLVNTYMRLIKRIKERNDLDYPELEKVIKEKSCEKITCDELKRLETVEKYLPYFITACQTQETLFECKQKIIDSIILENIELLSASQEEKIDFFNKNGYIFEIKEQNQNGNNLVFHIYSRAFKDPISLHIGNKYLDKQIKEYVENNTLTESILCIPQLSGKKLEYYDENKEISDYEIIEPGFYENPDKMTLKNIRVSNQMLLSQNKITVTKESDTIYVKKISEEDKKIVSKSK